MRYDRNIFAVVTIKKGAHAHLRDVGQNELGTLHRMRHSGCDILPRRPRHVLTKFRVTAGGVQGN